jgi:iron complex outermembrane receptor protein
VHSIVSSLPIRAAVRAAVLVALPIAALAADAQPTEGLEEVVVTAQFREEKLQDTPIAITAVTDEMMRARSQDSIFEVTQQAPNVQVKKNSGPFGASISAFIRGVGQGDFNFAREPGVGTYIDDIYFPTLTGAIFEILDLERVEVLRGPQGTLSGRNSIGGAIRLITKKPTGQGGSYAEVTTGRYNRIGARAAGEFSLTDNLSLRITGATNNQDGYVKRLDFACANPNDARVLAGVIRSVGVGRSGCQTGTLGGQSYAAGRAALRWLASERVELNLSADLVNDKSEASAMITPNAPVRPALGTYGAGLPLYGPWFSTPAGSYITYEDFTSPNGGVSGAPYSVPPINHMTSKGVALTVDVDLTDTLQFRSITSKRYLTNDFAALGFDGSPLNGDTVFNELDGHSLQQEFRLNGTTDLVDFTLGAFYFEQKNTNRNRVDIGYIGFPFDFISVEVADSESKALFAHSVWHLAEGFDLTAGLRYSDEKKDQLLGRLDPSTGGATASPLFGLPGGFAPIVTAKKDRIDYRVSVDYRWNESFMTYLSHSTGYKAGGVSPRFFFASHILPYGPEEAKAYEAGFKSDFIDNKLRVNGAIFVTDYTDQQTGRPGGVCPELTPPAPCLADGNFVDSRYKGAELEVTVRPTPDTIIDISASTIDAKYTRISPITLANPNFIADPNAPPGIPKNKYSIGVQHSFHVGNGTFTPRVDLNHEDKRNNAVSDLLPTPAFTVLNARATWRSADKDWETSVAVTNLTDKYYFYNFFDISNFGGWLAAQPAPPREWSLTVRRSF